MYKQFNTIIYKNQLLKFEIPTIICRKMIKARFLLKKRKYFKIYNYYIFKI